MKKEWKVRVRLWSATTSNTVCVRTLIWTCEVATHTLRKINKLHSKYFFCVCFFLYVPCSKGHLIGAYLRDTKISTYILFFSIFNAGLSFLFCRISVIFRVKSAKAVKITDMDLIKRLGLIVGVFVLFLLIRTLVSPPVVYTGKTDSINNIYIWILGWALKFIKNWLYRTMQIFGSQ